MSNVIGQTLLEQYRVDAFVASGGMGAVYRVWDLKRNVPLAMKVLHAELAEDPSVFKSFQREARALQKLAHPNIVPFYGLYQTLDFAFLLERYIDGPSLKDILRQRQGKPLSVEEALTYLKALCAALGYAHANGVIHCDVKPGNVMIDRGGNVYLTDFGIARHAESTTTTLAGAGAPQYMAPEQIRSEAVTPATDVYALGVMLFEMLTGQRPFKGTEAGTERGGTTAAERVRYAHQHLPPPDPHSLNPAIPEELAQVTLRALEKEPAKRYQSTQEMLAAVYVASGIAEEMVPERIVSSQLPPEVEPYATVQAPSVDTSSAPQPSIRRFGSRLTTGGGLMFTLIAIIAIILGGVFLLGRKGTINPPGSGGNVYPTQPMETTITQPPPFPNSPLKTLTQPPPIITASIPPSSTSRPTPTPIPLRSKPNGKIVFTCQMYGENHDQICIMNADGSGSHRLTTDSSSENFYPSLAPDGYSIVFSSNQTGTFEIYEMDLSGNQTRLTNGLGDLYAPEISPDGRSIVFAYGSGSYSSIWAMNRDGINPHQVYATGSDALDPSWSPDGNQILFAVGIGNDKQLYIMDKDGSNPRSVNQAFRTRGRSDWSPDGKLIAGYSGESWLREIYIMSVDGSNLHQISSGGNVQAPSFSPDGQWIAFTGYIDRYRDDNGCEIYIMRLDGSDVRRLTNNAYCDYQPRWGP